MDLLEKHERMAHRTRQFSQQLAIGPKIAPELLESLIMRGVLCQLFEKCKPFHDEIYESCRQNADQPIVLYCTPATEDAVELPDGPPLHAVVRGALREFGVADVEVDANIMMGDEETLCISRGDSPQHFVVFHLHYKHDCL